jgi:flagellar M-ring protein FliF
MALQRIKDLWRSLEPRGQLTIVGCALLVFVTFYFLYSYASKPSYATLVTGVDPAQTGQMTKALDTAGISYQITNGGTGIEVKDSQSSQARIALAETGLTTGGQVGFEIFNKVSMGATDFQQNVNYQRALEGEIDRAVQQINGITSADVQLVLPTDTLFADQGAKASAAVLLTTPGQMDPSTVSGIAHLVAASVKGLSTSDVTITDQTGTLLWPDPNAAGGGVNANTKLAADQLYSAQLASSINAMLNSTLGAGKAQARVHADLNVDQTTIDKTSYAKKGTPLQTQLQQEKLASKGGAPVLPAGAASNTTPTYPAAGSAGSSTSNYQNKSDNTTFGVDKTVQKTTVAPGTVNRLDVALLIDSSIPAATVASLQKSVASMAGVIPKRGDTLAVSRITFAKPPATAAAASPIAGLMANPLGLVKYVVLGLAAMIFLFMMRRGLKRRENEGVAAEPTWLREIQRAIPVAELEAGPNRNAFDPAGARRAALKAEAEEIAQKQPEQIAVQVSAWLKE